MRELLPYSEEDMQKAKNMALAACDMYEALKVFPKVPQGNLSTMQMHEILDRIFAWQNYTLLTVMKKAEGKQ